MELKNKIDEILEAYYHKQIDLLEVRKQFLKLIEDNYIPKQDFKQQAELFIKNVREQGIEPIIHIHKHENKN